MYQPRPHGKHSSSKKKLSSEDQAAAELLVRRLTNIKSTSGLESLKLVRALPSGAIAIAQDAGGVLRLIVQEQPEVQPEEPSFDGTATDYVPMLFSGVIRKAVLRTEDAVDLEITQATIKRLSSYSEDSEKIQPGLSLRRFAIRYNARVQELMPMGAEQGTVLYTQYAAQRPTWYSGAMAEVMQIVGGYGRQDFDDLPENEIERATLALPASVARKVNVELGNLRLPGYSGRPPKTGQFQYEYKFHGTNGVGFDESGSPWLIEVSQRGVYAMPLPIVPATTTEAFREWIEEVGDDEILDILDRFGGMPSGETFPVAAEDFESWRRAGVIIKVCDTADFYQNYMYASSCGWSFNKSGTSAVNTCYNFADDHVQVGHTYMLSLALGSAEGNGKLPHEFDRSNDAEARMLDAYLSSLYRQLDNSTQSLAIKYKLRRVPVADLLSRAGQAVENNSSPSGEIEYWDNLEVDPIAVHGGSVRQIYTGNLFAVGGFQRHPQIKFPEPFFDGCISHDFSPSERGAVPVGYIVRCNTIMHAYYVGDSLKTVSYFLDQRVYKQEVIDNYEDCMTVGLWERTETTGESSIRGHFYTSDIDERKVMAPVTTVTKIVGTDLGYDTQPNFSFDYFFAMAGSMWRNRYCQHVTETVKTESAGITLAVCIPYLERNAVFHAKKENITGGLKTNSLSVKAVGDPNSYTYYTYDFVFAWNGGPRLGTVSYADKVDPYPKDGNPVWVVGYSYTPTACSDFADQGDWVGGLPADYTWLIHPNRHEWQHSGGGGGPTVKPYSRTEHMPSKTEGELLLAHRSYVQKVNKNPSHGYFEASPNEFGAVFYVDAIKNCFGGSTYSNCSESDPDAPKQRKRWGYTKFADHKSAHHFIGVINE